jgi:hypothetical protein
VFGVGFPDGVFGRSVNRQVASGVRVRSVALAVEQFRLSHMFGDVCMLYNLFNSSGIIFDPKNTFESLPNNSTYGIEGLYRYYQQVEYVVLKAVTLAASLR